ncbi:MAG: glycosyltransferase [Phycisphaerae bacterium]|nr:glycosyltransferase [Phycisphaerae bacterium]
MRILHISTRLILGGSQENTVLSCEGQARLGHKVHLAFGPIHGPEGSLLDRVLAFNRGCSEGQERVRPVGRHVPVRDAGEPVVPIVLHEVRHLVREVSPAADWKCLSELRDLIGRIGPDVVHTHSSKAGILGRRSAWTFARPGMKRSGIDAKPPGIVHTIHGPPFMPVEGGFVGRARGRLRNWVYTVAERSAARRCHAIVSVADAMTRTFLDRSIGEPGQYVTVYSGMEVEAFLTPGPGQDRATARASLGLSRGDLVIGTVARLAEHKGHDDLLDALAEDLRSHPSWRLLWVGDGWWRTRLIERARSMGLLVREADVQRPAPEETSRANIVVTGLVPPDRVPAMIRAMDILAHPSYREGLPRTVPQALLCGVPVVAYDVDGTGEACIDGQTGVLVRAGDIDGLGGGVRALAEDPAARARLGAAGRERCEDRFDCEKMVAQLESVYARAVSAARR